ncbi:MAG: hypothetical protein ACFFAN_08585 [Promethearchaeota archaeon]
MKLIEELGKSTPNYIIITGDGRTELIVLRGLSQKYNGHNLILFFPFTPLPSKIPGKTGLSALKTIKDIPGDYKISKIIYVVDGDSFNAKVDNEIRDYLHGIGISVIDIEPIEEAFLIKSKFGNHNIKLYCIISGPQTFIEEEIARLFEVTLGINIDLSGTRDSAWKKRVKKKITKIKKKKDKT